MIYFLIVYLKNNIRALTLDFQNISMILKKKNLCYISFP